MSDAFTDVAKMKKIKEDIKAHEGQIVEMTLENGRKRQKSKPADCLLHARYYRRNRKQERIDGNYAHHTHRQSMSLFAKARANNIAHQRVGKDDNQHASD